MSDPVTVAEAALLARGPAGAWQHVLVLVVSGGLSRDELLSRIGERIGYAPRFRRVVDAWPLPRWIDDVNFTLSGHVGHERLEPGQQLHTWLEQKLQVPLSRLHPLWEVTLVDGLAGGAQAVVVRVHPALVDGYDHIHLFQELLDERPEAVAERVNGDWEPVVSAPTDLGAVMAGLSDPMEAAGRVVAGLITTFASGARPSTEETEPVFLGSVEVPLTAVEAIRLRHDCTVHDVVLALATAGLRAWAIDHEHPQVDQVAIIPLAVTEQRLLESAIGCRIAPSFDRLPLTVADPEERLQAIATVSRARRDSGVSVSARDLVELLGFAPATMHAVAAGVAGVGRPHALVVANVPGPQSVRYLCQAKVTQAHTLLALADGEQATVSITSYHGRISLAVVAREPIEGWVQAIEAELNALGGGVR